MTPCASAEINVACGAGSGFGATTPTFAAPANRLERTGGEAGDFLQVLLHFVENLQHALQR
jgi:hypothetical protein